MTEKSKIWFKKILLIFIIMLIGFIAYKAGLSKFFSSYKSCIENINNQTLASGDLKRMSELAFEDRKAYTVNIDAQSLIRRDYDRLQKTKNYIENKCIQSATDHEYAAKLLLKSKLEQDLILAIAYEQKAISMGHIDQIWVISNVIDQLLVQKGQKQLFGTQLGRLSNFDFCMYQVEPDFPDEIRIRYTNANLKQMFHDLLTVINPVQDGDNLIFCDKFLSPTKRGNFPGIW